MPLYGVGVVLAGALQAQRRFLAAALAPLVSSLVVAAQLPRLRRPCAAGATTTCGGCRRPRPAVLAGGTTLGVVALAAAHAPAAAIADPAGGPGCASRPGTARSVRSLALAGLAGAARPAGR